VVVLIGLLGCTGELTTDGPPATDAPEGDLGGGSRDFGTADRDGATPPGDSGTATDGGSTPQDSGVEVPIDAGPCGAGGLASRFSSSPLATSPTGRVFAAPTLAGGVVVASGGSPVTLQRFSGDGSAAGGAVPVAGNRAWGLAVNGDEWGVLVDRGSDALYLVVVRPDGGEVFATRLLGEVDHSVTNNEWFGTGIRYARLHFAAGQWGAYYTVNRLWPDGIAHYGDQLQYLDTSGASAGMAWSWGCSHSMEVRLTHNETLWGPICISDCYPSKGIHFNHRSAELYTDSEANCAGGYGTSLGDLVPVADGFWATFAASDGRASDDVAIMHVGNDRRASGAPIWLSEDGAPDRNVRAARYGSGLVVGWSGAGGDVLTHLDGSGATLEAPVTIDAGLGGASDFFVLADGDVGWVSGGELKRLRTCE